MAEQLIGTGQARQLSSAQRQQQIGGIIINLETEHRRSSVIIEQTLSQQQISEIKLLDLIQVSLVFHFISLHAVETCFPCIVVTHLSGPFDDLL